MQAVALVGRVTDVQPHPDNHELINKMDVVTISGKTNVANRPSPDQPRYQVGDYAVMLTENLILPEWLIKHLDLWDETKGKGMLGGKLGNRLRPRNMGVTTKIKSEVALVAVVADQSSLSLKQEDGTYVFVTEGQDVAENLGIKEAFEPQQ